MREQTKPAKRTPRTYFYTHACVFRKTREAFGGLSNMASGFPLKINGVFIPSSEALYQALRYPHLPDVQAEIVGQNSGMSAKMKSKKYYDSSREDWEEIKVNVMRWCLEIKLAQNFLKFGLLLESTGQLDIVEESSKDSFWGAIPVDGDILVGINALGRLLMELRQKYQSEDRYNLLYVKKISIPEFNLFGKSISDIDERKNFIAYITRYWDADHANLQELSSESQKSGTNKVLTKQRKASTQQNTMELPEREVSSEK